MTQICRKWGCDLPVWIEPRTNIVHDFCGRTHAIEMLQSQVLRPHGNCHDCNLLGCSKEINFDPDSGRVHDFCCKDHANKAIARGEWAVPIRDQMKKRVKPLREDEICRLPGCLFPAYICPNSARRYDYCGRSHATEAKLMSDNPAVPENVFSSPFSSSSSSSMYPSKQTMSLQSRQSNSPAKEAFTGSSMAKPSNQSLIPQSSAAFTPNSEQTFNSSSVQTTKQQSSSYPSTSSITTRDFPRNAKSKFSTSSKGNSSEKSTEIETPFCVVCQDHTADMIVLNCRHICLCYEHVVELGAQDQLKVCPLCQQPVTSIARVRGLTQK